MFWNVQRLFAPVAGPVGRALGVTGESWSRARYKRKVHNLGQCIRRIEDAGSPLALIGLAEVETPLAVRDVRDAAGLETFLSVDDHAEDPSLDALDVALLYDSNVFEDRPVKVESISLDNRFSTRDLLRVRLALRGGPGEVEVFVAHWPSRVISEGESLRMAYSIYLRRLVTQVLKYDKSDLLDAQGEVRFPSAPQLRQRWNTGCIIMGDFNDEPFDTSIRVALEATRDRSLVLKRARLKGKALNDAGAYLGADFSVYNPCWDLDFFPHVSDQVAAGTYYRSPEWRTYDQVLFTHGLLGSSRARFAEDSLRVARLGPFDGSLGAVKMSTSTGLPRAFDVDDPDGVSDHFPLLWDIDVRDPHDLDDVSAEN